MSYEVCRVHDLLKISFKLLRQQPKLIGQKLIPVLYLSPSLDVAVVVSLLIPELPVVAETKTGLRSTF